MNDSLLGYNLFINRIISISLHAQAHPIATIQIHTTSVENKVGLVYEKQNYTIDNSPKQDIEVILIHSLYFNLF